MSKNPVWTTVFEILEQAQPLMNNALSLAWNHSKSQEMYVRRTPSWQGSHVPTSNPLGVGSRVLLHELTSTLPSEFERALKHKLKVSLGMQQPATHDPKQVFEEGTWTLEGELRLAGNAVAGRRVRVGRIVTLLESTCAPELQMMVGLQIDCLRFYKAPSNPFRAEVFADALLTALEVTVPHDQQQQEILQVLGPAYAQALQAVLRGAAKSMARKLQAFTALVAKGDTWQKPRTDSQFEPTMPAGL